MTNHRYKWLLLGLLPLALVLVSVVLVGAIPSASAAPALQLTVFPTPTPGPDGRIIYIVQPGDTLWRVAAITGVSLDDLRTLNNLGPDEPIIPDQQLLIGLAGPPEATAQPVTAPTAQPTPAESTAMPGFGTLCVMLFDDQNGDSIRQEEEESIPGGELSISDRSGEVSQTDTTSAAMEPVCYEDLPEGNYNLTVAIPDGFNPTTELNYTLVLEAGRTAQINFGAQPNSATLAEESGVTGESRSPLLGILGAVLLVGGVGLGIFAGRLTRKPKEEN